MSIFALVWLAWLCSAALGRRLEGSADYITTADNLQVSPRITKGMVIDAGSGGSRLHVYHWKPRVFAALPPSLSYPTAEENWTARMAPGVATLADYDSIMKHLSPLIDFAKNALVGFEDEYYAYPIYFKATGGMRELTVEKREAIMTIVRKLLSDKSFCPFYFRSDMARVISGEEEAIFSWSAINFLMGNLLPLSEGIGEANTVLNGTYGTLDLGGASSQIAFFIPTQDIMEGLFKLQIGAMKHWNVYTKSYLSFGHVSARERHLVSLASSTKDVSIINLCFHAGYSENVVIPGDSSTKTVEVKGPASPSGDAFDKCRELLVPLLNKNNEFCKSVYFDQCAIDGAYQPSLPAGQKFIGTSSYKYAWNILMLQDTASFQEYKRKAKFVCSLSFSDAMLYSDNNNLSTTDEKLSEIVPYFCFMSVYTYVLLQDGFGFKDEQSITVLDQVNGNKVGWALGAILHEINTLPWELAAPGTDFGPLFIAACIGIIIGAIIAFFLSKELLTEHKLMLSTPHGLSHSRLSETSDSGENWQEHITQYNPFDKKHQYNIIA